jgi:hypothetical protein
MSAQLTKAQLAKSLHCSQSQVYRRADAMGIPYEQRDGVRATGEVFYYRVYLREDVDRFRAALADEQGRIAARKRAS